jgi:hypothetical protein
MGSCATQVAALTPYNFNGIVIKMSHNPYALQMTRRMRQART